MGSDTARQIYVGLGADHSWMPEALLICSVWRTDGQRPRQRVYQRVIDEIIELRRIGFRYIALADDNSIQ